MSSNLNINGVLLVTGGTGSSGKALLKRVIKEKSFKEIRIFSRDEKKQDDMRRSFKSENIRYFIGDVRDSNSLTDAMTGVDCVFHAATQTA